MTEKMMNDMFESTNSFHPDIVDCVEKEKKALTIGILGAILALDETSCVQHKVSEG